MSRLTRWTSWVTTAALLVLGVSQVPASAAPTAPHNPHVQPIGDGNWKPTPAPKPAPVAWTSPKGKNAPLVKSDPKAKRISELTDRRTADTSYYKLADGSVQEEISAYPVHYRDSKGKWQNIDTTVKPLSHNGFVAGATANAFQTYYGSAASSMVRVEQGTGSIEMGLDGAKVSAPKISGSTATYPGALPGADVSYQSGPDGLDERIVLAEPPAAGTAFNFTLEVSGFTPKQLPGGAIAFYGGESADPAFVIPAPYMADSKPDTNSPYGTAYSAKVTQSMTYDAASGTVHVTVTPDASWLSDSKRVYPVTVDPTLIVSSTSSTAANVMILADGPTTNYSTSWRLSVGTTPTGAARSLIRFALPSVPAGTTLTSADLQLYYDQTFTDGSKTVPLQALAANASWNPATATWSNASAIGGPVAGTSQMTGNQLGVWNDFPVTSTVQSWLNGTLANNGFVLKATNEGTLSQGGPRYEGAGYYYNGEVKNYPKLVITYGVPGVTVNPPSVIHSTGAELSWPTYSNTTGNSANDIVEYQVHRSIYQTFTPTADTEIAPVQPAQTSFVDSTAVPTPANNADPYGNAYYYMVAVKTKSGALIAGPTTVVRLPEAGRTTLLIPTQSATTLSSSQPSAVLNTLSNVGTPQPWLEVGDNSGTYGLTRSVLNFPALTAVPSGSKVLEAHLKLWQETTTTNTSGAVYELHALTRPFTGSQATWNSAATGTAWTTAGGDYTAAADGTLSHLTNDPNRQNLDATSIVQGWVDNPATADGLLVKLSSEGSTAPQERTIFAGPATAEPALAPALVVTYLDASTGSTYYAPSTPTDMNPGTTYSVPVTVNNTTTGTWTAADEVLTYHWTLPDGTDVTGSSQLRTALPSDLAPAATVTLNAQVTPPAPTDGNQAEGATLAWDMYNKTTGVYLSAGATNPAAPAKTNSAKALAPAASSGGIGSLKQQVSVDPSGNNQLGLENFYPYATTPTGSGATLYSNEASGNTVWNDDLFSNPSVGGFATTLRLSYNSLSTMDTTTGFGWSIEASAPVRLGQALQFHPPGNPTSMVMVDGTGNAHQWNLVNGTWQSPPGVHLFLQGTACKPQDTNSQAWKMTRPDRTTYYFDCEGYPTKQIDANGNEADFSYVWRQSENKPEEFLAEITDPLHIKTLTVDYYNKGDAFEYIDSTGTRVPGTNLTDPAIIDHVKSITDVSGRRIDFYYTSEGLLGQVVDGADSTIPKTLNFSYDATQGMKNVKLVKVQDPRQDSTVIQYYDPSSPTKWWTKSVTDRNGHTASFAYNPTSAGDTTTVTDADNHNWTYTTDPAGRLTQQVDPAIQVNGASVSPTTRLGWDTDNNVNDLVENNGAHSEWEYDTDTGYPKTFKDPVGVKNATADAHHTVYTYATADSADQTLSGHIAFLTDITSPEGRRTHYTYYPLSSSDPGYVATQGYAGNLESSQAPDGTAAGAAPNTYLTTYTYDMYGQAETVKDANGHTTTYDRTYQLPDSSTPFPEPTGQPRTITDALGKSTRYEYGARGETTSVTDPLGHKATRDYDVFLRPLDSQIPKDTGSTITVPAPVYDGNNNILSSTAPTYTGAPIGGAVTSTSYDKNDQPQTVTLPANNGTTARKIVYGYDNLGNKTSVTQPLGDPNASPPTYTTLTTYNAINEPDSTKDAAGDQTLFGYDDVGNKTSITDPRGNVSKVSYDFDHRIAGTTDAGNNTTSVAYDMDGIKKSTTDQVGAETDYTVDSDGQVTQVKVPHDANEVTGVVNYNTIQYTYDQVGNNTGVISPLGVAALGTPTAGSYTTNTVYDADNRVSKALGAYLANDANYGQSQRPETDYGYDDAGRLTGIDRITQPIPVQGLPTPPPDHAVTKVDYFDNGWTRTSTDPFNVTTHYEYNALGQQITRELASSDSTESDSNGVVGVGSTQRYMNWSYYPDGSVNTFQDSGVPNGWQDQVFTADSGTTQLQMGWNYGPDGKGYNGSTYATGTENKFTWNLSVPQDGNYTVYVWYSVSGTPGAEYNLQYDGGTTPPGGIIVDQTKNVGRWVSLGSYKLKAGATGQFVSVQPTGPGAATIADAVRIVRDNSTDPQPPTPNRFTYQYDPNGNLSDIADGSPNAQYDHYKPTYNNINQITQLLENKGTTTQHTLTYKYDPAGNLIHQSQDAVAGDFEYTNLNQLSKVTDTRFAGDPGIVTKYSYWQTGQLQTETKGNGNNADYVFNMDRTLYSSTETNKAGAIVDQHTLGYDPNNNVAVDSQTLANGDSGGARFNRATTYGYSPNNQVTSVQNGQDDQSYQYNSSGNVVTQTVNKAQAGFGYRHGRVVAQDAGGLATGTYEYDTVGRLHDVVNGYFNGTTTGVGQEYTYDGFDNILSQSTKDASGAANTDTYTYDSLGRALTEAINAGQPNAPDQHESIDYVGTSKTIQDENITAGSVTDLKAYDYAPTGERLALLDTTDTPTTSINQTSYYSYNQHQDVEALTDQNGVTTGTYGYSAFGSDDPSLDSGPDKGTATLAAFPYNSFRFNSGRVATATGNLSMGFRTYDPNINSFVSRDMFNGSSADTALAANPANGSRYGFAGGDPISNIEQDGHDWLSILGGIAGAAAVIGGCALAGVGTAGLAAFACAVGAGVAGGLAAQGVTCAENGGSSCSPGAFAVSGTVGAVSGAVAFGVGAILPASLSGWAAGGIVGASAGAGGYGAGCALGAECSWTGLAEATALGGAAGAALGAVGGDVTCGGESFTADTKVQLADGGAKAISTLKPGDKVKSTDTATGKTKSSATSAVMVNHDTDLYDLTVHTAKGDRVVHTTAKHLFYDRTTHKWTEAAALSRGDALTTPDGSAATVVSGTTPAVSSGDMWDLTVPGDHDFYVLAGDTPVLVHNCAAQAPKPKFVWRNGRVDANGELVTDTTPQGTLPADAGLRSGASLSAGEYHYVVNTDGSLRVIGNEDMWAHNPDAGHTSLAGYDAAGHPNDVVMAGTFTVNEAGEIDMFDNMSGHYRPGVDPAYNEDDYMPLEQVAREAFAQFGLPSPLPDAWDPVWMSP